MQSRLPALATQRRTLDCGPSVIVEVANILEQGVSEFGSEQGENGHHGDAYRNDDKNQAEQIGWPLAPTS